ncbi:MAG: hypothetical protein ACSLFD_02140 [Solirubrobacterales bacterium]
MEDTDASKNLKIYLNDHYSGSTGGLELAKRARGNSTDPERTAMWEAITVELTEEREILREMIDRAGTSRNAVKTLLSWAAEKAGRLKPNGQVTGPSGMAQFLELEMLLIGVTGKMAMWRTLRMVDDPRFRSVDFAGLIEQAESQRERLDEHRLNLALPVFSDKR